MPATGSANIGVVGLAVMGSNLARNLASRAGNTVAVFNRSPERTNILTSEHPEAGFVASGHHIRNLIVEINSRAARQVINSAKQVSR